MKLKPSEINHLRRLLGYVRCEIWQSPEELKETVRSIASVIDPANHDGQARLVEAYRKAESVPQYVRAAVKALEKLLADSDGDTVDGQINRALTHPTVDDGQS